MNTTILHFLSFCLMLCEVLATANNDKGICPIGWHQSEVVSNKCYGAITTNSNWFDAQLTCGNAIPGGQLTSIGSAFENVNINAVAQGAANSLVCDYYWIGGNDLAQPHNFTWVDDRQFSYTNWQHGQPLAGDCMAYSRLTGQWRSDVCGVEYCSICEFFVDSSSTNSPTTTRVSTTTATVGRKMTDCYDWLHIGGQVKNGIYRIEPPGIAPFDVLCDMETDGGGWTYFQKRQDGSVSFWNNTWMDYKNGFDNGLENNAWLGLDRIHLLTTKDANVSMRIDIRGNRCTPDTCRQFGPNTENGHWYGEWTFSVENEANNYRAHVSTILTGNLTVPEADNINEGMDGQEFTTNDNDHASAGWVAQFRVGAWWYSNLIGGSIRNQNWLNGKYNDISGYGISAYYRPHYDCHTGCYFIIPKETEIKLRKVA